MFLLHERKVTEKHVKQTTGIQNLDLDSFLDESTCFPPLPEQQVIAAFLDRETARIDALIARKERLLELLEEKRKAIISQAVTRGLDASVPMKDSGVEWLGQVPEGWAVQRLKNLSRFVTSGSRGWAEFYADSGSTVTTQHDEHGKKLTSICSRTEIAC